MITAKDYAAREGFKSIRDRIILLSIKEKIRWNGKISPEGKVHARIDYGRWMADCPYCNGAEAVDPDEPIFFCLSCGMKENGGNALEVIFPKEREEIEKLLEQRPQFKHLGRDKIEKVILAKPVYEGLGQHWAGEKIRAMKKANKRIEK